MEVSMLNLYLEANKNYELYQDPKMAAERFFELIDLENSRLCDVKSCFESGEYNKALNLYKDIFVEYCSTLDFGKTTNFWNCNNIDQDEFLEGNIVMSGRYRPEEFSLNYVGKAPHIEWFKPTVDKVLNRIIGQTEEEILAGDRNFATHLCAMFGFLKIIAAFAGEIDGSKYSQEEYIKYWVNSLHDFSLRHRLGYEKIVEEDKLGDYDRLDYGRYCGLYVGWRVNNFFDGITLASRANKELVKEHLSGLALANILHDMITDHIDKIIDRSSYPAAANQQVECIVGILRAAYCTVGLKEKDKVLETAEVFIHEYANGGSMLKDGSDREQSFNYNTALLQGIEQIRGILKAVGEKPSWLDGLQETYNMRYRFLNSLVRPSGIDAGNLIPGEDQYGDGKEGVHHSDTRASNGSFLKPFFSNQNKSVHHSDTVVDSIYDHIYNKGKAPVFSSIAFPYGGFYVMRDGFLGDAKHLYFKTSRAATGHCSSNRNSIQLTAFGKTFLVDSGPTAYTEGFVTDYMHSSFAHNTVSLDGLSQQLGITNGDFDDVEIDYNKPIDAHWYSGKKFDLASGTHKEGYGMKIKGDQKTPIVSDVIHKRYVVFVKELGVFVVIDKMTAQNEHTYSRVWNFHPDYKKEDVKFDKEIIYTDAKNEPNISIYNYASVKPTYESFYGEKEPNVRGFYKGSWDSQEIAKTDVHESYVGKDINMLAVLEPMEKGAKGRILKTYSDYNMAELIFEDKSSLLAVFGKDEMCVRVRTNGKEYSLTFDESSAYFKENNKKIMLLKPTGFKWKETEKGYVPEYK